MRYHRLFPTEYLDFLGMLNTEVKDDSTLNFMEVTSFLLNDAPKVSVTYICMLIASTVSSQISIP